MHVLPGGRGSVIAFTAAEKRVALCCTNDCQMAAHVRMQALPDFASSGASSYSVSDPVAALTSAVLHSRGYTTIWLPRPMWYKHWQQQHVGQTLPPAGKSRAHLRSHLPEPPTHAERVAHSRDGAKGGQIAGVAAADRAQQARQCSAAAREMIQADIEAALRVFVFEQPDT